MQKLVLLSTIFCGWDQVHDPRYVIYHFKCQQAIKKLKKLKKKPDFLKKIVDLGGGLCYIMYYLSDERFSFCALFCTNALHRIYREAMPEGVLPG